MIREVRIETMQQVMDLIAGQQYRQDLKRHRDLRIYRGENNSAFTLSTSLTRNCKSLSKVLEKPMLENFTKYAVLEEPIIEGNVWKQMIVGQHHGFPTRLLDWSFSPLMALHFATSENDLDQMDAHDAVVWRIDVNDLHDRLPEKYQKVMEKYSTTVFSVDMLNEACESPDQYDEDMKNECMLVIEPPSLDRRIISQYSFFTIVPQEMHDIIAFLDEKTDETVRFVIAKELRWQIRDFLDHQNITERMVYPGLDGLSRWLGRHYFVR
ncbi:MAG: FRG domain-containing protein [Oscillospiraceae bacterium]|nr:FRG domain-containing protein [Oscillospiraceae bacterium]